MASYLGLQKKFLPNLKQYEATTGRPVSDRAMQNYLYAALQTEADRKDTAYARERQFGLQQQSLDLQKQSIADTASANKISGVTQLAGLPFQGYLGYKAGEKAGLWGGTPTPPAATVGTSQGLIGGAGATTAQAGLTAPGTFAGSTGYMGAATPAMYAPEMYGGVAATEGAGAGLLGTAGTVALPAAGGAFVGHTLGKPVSKLLGTHQKTTEDVMGVAGGAAMGFAVGGPVGAVIGGAIGFVSSLF